MGFDYMLLLDWRKKKVNMIVIYLNYLLFKVIFTVKALLTVWQKFGRK